MRKLLSQAHVRTVARATTSGSRAGGEARSRLEQRRDEAVQFRVARSGIKPSWHQRSGRRERARPRNVEGFHADLNEAVPASEQAVRSLFGADESSDFEVLPKQGVRIRRLPPAGATEALATVKHRRGQEYFRDAVINNSGGVCGVTGLAVRQLLVASHILPWYTPGAPT